MCKVRGDFSIKRTTEQAQGQNWGRGAWIEIQVEFTRENWSLELEKKNQNNATYGEAYTKRDQIMPGRTQCSCKQM